MSAKQFINEAVISQLLNLMRNGQINRCTEMGLEPDVLGQMQHPTVMSLLANTTVSWCTVTVNQSVLRKLIQAAERTQEETRLLERALHLGATTSVMQTFFGMTPQEITLHRIRLGVKPPLGRTPRITEDLDEQLWHRWTQLMAEHSVDLRDSMALLDVVLMVTEELLCDGLSLGPVWTQIAGWISEGLYPPQNPQRGDTALASTRQPKLSATKADKQPAQTAGAVVVPLRDPGRKTDRSEHLAQQEEGDVAP